MKIILASASPRRKELLEQIGIEFLCIPSQKEEKIIDFIKKIKNPYLCKCGNIVVQSVFEETDKTLTECLIQYLKMI